MKDINTNNITQWDSQLQIGSDLIDNQHQIIFGIIKDTRIAINSGANIRVIDALLGVLLNYFFHHFNSEEEFMRSHPDYDKHRLEHYAFIKKLNKYIDNFRNKRLSNEQASENFLVNLWIDHIENFDQPFLAQNDGAANLENLTIQTGDFKDDDVQDKRQHRRILHNQVVDGKILADCYNETRLLRRKASIIDMSPGGLKFQSTGNHMVDDLLIITCSIGTNFNLKEKAKVVSARNHNYGVEFIAPAKETLRFFTQLYGSVFLNRIPMA